jgi:uncharacterized protein (UPF0210 family)
MNIRALTGFLDPGWPIRHERLVEVADTLNSVKDGLQAAGYTVQTLRLATPPPSEIQTPVTIDDRTEFAIQLEAECFARGIDYVAIGPALPEELADYHAIPAILENTASVFASGLFADPSVGLSPQAAAACAEVIQKVSTISDDGFANLRFAALANVPSGSPFFPAAYHRQGPPAIGVATEAADLAVTAFKDGISIQSASRLLIEAIEGHASVISKVAKPIVEQREIRFQGIDFSLAPYPEESRSLGTALNALGVPASGVSGTVTAAAIIAQCLDQANFERTGFCGLFLPVLEDSVLAEDAGSGTLSIVDLLLMATICGTGLDTIPLAGDTSADQMYALLLDLGALALRHDKPLTARLMPIPGKAAGDEITFDFPYFAPSRVMSLDALPLGGELAAENPIVINPHPSVGSSFPTT